MGASALAANTSGAQNTTVGNQAGATTNAAYLVAVGYQAARYNTGDGNTAIGTNALLVSGGVNGTGTNNVAVGKDALYTNTTASNNTAVGYQAGYTNQTGSNNAFFGAYAGYAVTTGQYNTFIGRGDSRSAGDSMTTGSKNTILGAYTGNQGGLDIRTASNQVVISDGDGNPRAYWTDLGGMLVGSVSWTFTNPNTGGASIKGGSQGGGVPIVEIGNTDATSSSDGSPALMCFKNSATTNSNARFIQFSASGTATTMGAIVGAGSGVCAFANFSDISLKKNIQPLSGSLAKIIALKPSSYDMIADDSHVNAGLIAQDVQQVYPEYVVENMSDEGKPPLMGITGGLSGGFISELICAIQEQQAIIESLKARLDAA
ncbi:MAG: tail fiber domain-containing protein, partial [Betaproteobacteria bacterium]|nr:tail fiber domain-containing protein [Betaproteobacteria bacterium]